MLTNQKVQKPYAGLSLDLDNEWSYLKTHGDASWQGYPSFLHLVMPRILSVLNEFDLKITFFIVGRDAEIEKNRGYFSSIVNAGHEIGNHSHNHEPWTRGNESEYEIAHAEDLIEQASGIRPRGYRGAGYSMSNATLEILTRRGYKYDTSTLPTFLGPLARAYYFLNTSLNAKQKEERGTLFGSFRDGLRPLKPYLWQVGNLTIPEIPVTTIPFVRMPFHFSYLLYISSYSPSLARFYWRSGLRACRLAGVEPALLLHSLDFLGHDDVTSLSFFPGMDLRAEVKIERIRNYLADLAEGHHVLPMEKYADTLQTRGHLETRLPDFH
jgi:peptidoglycan-N-acetylglucosamine deacetylase